MNNSLIIHYHGKIKYSEKDNIILISEDSNWKNDSIKKQLQIDFLNIEDYVKATRLINQEFNEINKIIIINDTMPTMGSIAEYNIVILFKTPFKRSS